MNKYKFNLKSEMLSDVNDLQCKIIELTDELDLLKKRCEQQQKDLKEKNPILYADCNESIKSDIKKVYIDYNRGLHVTSIYAMNRLRDICNIDYPKRIYNPNSTPIETNIENMIISNKKICDEFYSKLREKYNEDDLKETISDLKAENLELKVELNKSFWKRIFRS